MTERTRWWTRVSATILILALRSATASAAPPPVNGTALWSSQDRVYVAARDSGAFVPGWRVTFLDRDRPIATGEVTDLLHGELAVMRLTSGSLDRVKHLDRVRIVTEAPPPRTLPLLRIGAPSRRRANLVVECSGLVVAPPVPGGYVGDTTPDGSTRFVRLPDADRGRWPDTLLVRFFDDATDQEIAFERAELDVAIFWPGEMSAHLRETPRGRAALFGTRARSVLTGTLLGDAAARSPDRDATWNLADLPELASMNDQLFRGDLAPLASPARPERTESTPRAAPIVYRVDTSLPGHVVLQRFLDRTRIRSGPTRTLVFAYADMSVAPLDSLSVASEPRPLFAVRCPIVCAAGLRPYVESIGADGIVDLLICAPR